MIWSVMPEEIIMATGELKSHGAPREIIYRNRRMLATPLPNGRMCVVRMLSSDPRDYLDPRFQPGSVIELYRG